MLSNPLKKGLEEAIHKFKEYHFAKYKAEDKAVKMRDVLRIVHPKPKDKQESDLFKRIIEGTLVPPETWEVYISTNGSSKKTWEAIMPKMPIMAKLRNLRNFVKFGCDVRSLIKDLTDEQTILKSKQFPFRFFSAYKALELAMQTETISPAFQESGMRLQEALEKALEISVKNLPHIPGTTFMTADNSGSMRSSLSPRSTVSYSDIANLLQAMAYYISDNAITSVFGDGFAVVPVNKKDGILNNMLKFKNTSVGWATNAHLAIDHLIKNRIEVDRILLFSDMQTYDSRWGGAGVNPSLKKYRKLINPNVIYYSFDLSGYGTLTVPEKETYIISGWSEKVLNFIDLNEKKGISAIKEVEAYKPFNQKSKKRKKVTKP